MPMTHSILLGLMIVVGVYVRASRNSRHSWSWHLAGWKKLFGLAAIVFAVLVVINPELLALGLFTDAAFFDMLVLAMSLQLYAYATQVWHTLGSILARAIRWAGIPSPGLMYGLGMATLVFTSAATAVSKATQRIV